MPEVTVVGTAQERKTFSEVKRHYDMANEDLTTRIQDFDKKDILFRSHIEPANYPYRSLVFDPRVFTAIFEKTSRLLANKPRGRLVPREGGDSLKAKICSELLSFQWDDAERVDAMPMLAKWAQMDMNARKYGASFGLAKWHWQRELTLEKDPAGKSKGKPRVVFDGPNFVPLNNRDCLPNPSYSTIKHWFQHREYVTFQDLANTNDAARTQPIYKNLDHLRDKLREESQKGGDRREDNTVSKNKAIKGLTDYLGHDEVFRTIELITEYRPDRWITFSPKHGVILRDIPNPYDHGQIPVVMLKYYAIDDDLYGLSEIEPVERLQKALNAYVNQNLDTLNMSTYTPLKVNSTGGAVQMHTLEFGPGKKWMMANPQSDVLPFESNPQGVAEFVPTYRLMVGAMQEALGETSAAISGMEPGAGNKTATEVRDLAVTRNARDNFNQLFLAEALKKQMLFWHTMDKQFMFSDPTQQQKIMRIVGKEAISYFQENGLDGEGLTDESIEMLSSEEMTDAQDIIDPREIAQPLYPVTVNGETVPKLTMDEDGQGGTLILEPEDLDGLYDYVPDVESMQLPDTEQLVSAGKQLIEIALNPATTQLLMQEGFQIKTKEILEDYFERLGVKDADKYFEKVQQGQVDPMTGQPMMGGVPNGQGQTGGIPPQLPGAGLPPGGPQAPIDGGNGGIPAGI